LFGEESTYLFGFVEKCIFYFTQWGARFDSQEFIIVHLHSVKKKAKEYNTSGGKNLEKQK